jgi:hypothetical protein
VLQIRAIGAVKETIEEGAYVLLQVKYGLIRLIKQTIDLCEQVGNVDLECPIEPGVLDLTKEVELPNEIPPVGCVGAVSEVVPRLTNNPCRANTRSSPTSTRPTTSPLRV